ncbi:MAG: hypothetical protein HFE81_05380 [Bacilli bacterium]|nr:hypothetical protein [Bacilli bacterium]
MEEINLRELFDYFKSKITWVIIAVILVIGIGNIATIIMRVPMYRSSTTIVLVSENNTGDSTYNSSELQLNKNLVGTYSEIIKSRKVLNEVISNLGLSYSTVDLSENISVAAVENTEIIRITVADADNKQAAKIANEIASVFMTEIQKFYKLNNVSVIDKAENSLNPYNVNYIKDNLIYLIIGLALSSGVIFIMFYFDTTIKTSEEIENKLGLTVLGVVPKVERN